jgi:BirA family transcriptional regulator, biotin operon repressor / biotin---[acetyl-CoA-carboxylase] ligase
VPDTLAPDAVKPLLRGRFGEIYRYETTTASTQRLFEPGDPEGTVAVAEEQTEGRGRLGRSWEAPSESSILVSVLLLPAVEAPKLPELSLIAGGAVAEAIKRTTGIEPSIKFPNDVLIRGRKVAGVLAESSEGRVLLGIGVNVNQSLEELPLGAQIEPTSLRLELQTPVNRPQLLAEILLQLERAYDAWVMGIGVSG